ncbi:MAG: hypothetical protein ABIH28_00210 [archaeon]
MLKNTITLTKLTQAKVFCDTSNEFAFYNSLKECGEEGFKPTFVPEVVDLMLRVNDDSQMWHYNNNWVGPSVKIRGKSKQGNDVVVYAHVPTFFSNVGNFQDKQRHELYRSFSDRETPQSEFEKILELEDNENVFVHDYFEKRKEKNKFGFDEALEKTRLVSLLGGKERAGAFLKRTREHFKEIEINDSDTYLQCNDRNPRYGNTRLIDISPVKISSWNDFGFARFIGTREIYPVLDKAILDFDSLFKEVSELSLPYVPEVAKEEFVDNLKNLIIDRD